MAYAWPAGFPRIPDEPWTGQPIDPFAQGYDRLARHAWYRNLDPTAEAVLEAAGDGMLVVDYSGGTGLLIDRLLRRAAGRRFGLVDVDASPKFLRMALEKHRAEERVAFRHLAPVPGGTRLLTADEALAALLAARRADVLACTNAVHLYPDIDETFASWARVLRPGGRVFLQSGNIAAPAPTDGLWIIDDTVRAVARAAEDVARDDVRFSAYRGTLADEGRMRAYRGLADRYFLAPRPEGRYVKALEAAGFQVSEPVRRRIPVDVTEWTQFLAVYHEGILPWVGGAEKVDGRPPLPEAVEDRRLLLRLAMARVFGDARSFDAEWTYLDGTAAL